MYRQCRGLQRTTRQDLADIQESGCRLHAVHLCVAPYSRLMSGACCTGAGAVQVSNVEMLSSGTTQAGTQGVLARVIPSPYSEQRPAWLTHCDATRIARACHAVVKGYQQRWACYASWQE